MSDMAKISVRDKNFEVPLFTGTEGEMALDITKLRGQTGLITIDDGYMNTGAGTSAITFLTERKGFCVTADIPSNSSLKNPHFLRSPTC